MNKSEMTDEQLNDIYTWIDQIPLSKPKKNIARDFSDGLMVAEVIHFFIPKIVSVHNYPSSHNRKQKLTNWTTLNRKVLKQLHFQIKTEEMEKISKAKNMAIENFLFNLRTHIEKYLENPPPPKSMKRKDSADKRSNYQQRYNDSRYDKSQSKIRNEFMPQDTPISTQYPAPGPYTNYGHHTLAPRGRNTPTMRRPSPGLQRMGLNNLGNPVEKNPINYPGNKISMDPQRYNSMTKGQLISQLKQKDGIVLDLRDTVEILELKIKKMEQLIHLKEGKIRAMKRANGV